MKKFLAIFVLALMTMGTVLEAQGPVRMPRRPDTRRNVHNHHSIPQMEQGFWCAVEFDLASSMMPQSRNMQDMGLQFVGGYRISEFLRLGLGVGFRNYINDPGVRDRDDAWAFPLFFNARGNIVTQEIYHAVPFWSLSVGSATRDGMMVQPNIGVRFGTPRNAFTAAIGYRFQQMNTTYDCKINERDAVNFLALTLGYEF